jgi:hypothetical protein
LFKESNRLASAKRVLSLMGFARDRSLLLHNCA